MFFDWIVIFFLETKIGHGILDNTSSENNKQNSDDDDSSDDSDLNLNQEGHGIEKTKLKRKYRNDSDIINKIAEVVVKKINNQTNLNSEVPLLQSSSYIDQTNLNPQIPIIQTSQDKNTLLPYSNVISENDEADDFDEKKLLSLVPYGHKKNAKRLLKIINENGQSLTFNSQGVIFINGVSVPNSNLFEIFPYLYKFKKPKNISGLMDFVNQLQTMGLSNLIVTRLEKNPEKSNTSALPNNFWFLG